MPKIHDLKIKRSLYKNIQRIVDSMKMITVVKLRKNTQLMKHAQNFQNCFASNLLTYSFLTNIKSTKTLNILICLNRSLLCGNYLTSLNKLKQEEGDWVILGSKLPVIFKRLFAKGANIIFNSPTTSNLSMIEALSELIFSKKEEYKQIINYSWDASTGNAEKKVICTAREIEQKQLKYTNLTNDIGKEYMIGLLNLLIANAMTMEEKRRLMCIDQASKNTEQIMKDLDKSINQARQAQITNELNEVISGCEYL